ncbi:MAG: FAD-dependent oxidoreductase [Actinomycetota bacterium]|nr:FAD-dependent oxidoreductase [Actinomycetota bacterium]
MERFDVFVIGGGATGSEVAFRLGREGGLRVGMAERDRLGGECNNYGCVPTKVMLRSAKIAALARDAERFGVHIPTVEIDLAAVMDRVRAVIDASSGEEAEPFEDLGITVVRDAAHLVGPHEIEIADGTRVVADRIVLATGTTPQTPPIPGLEGAPFWTNREAIWTPTAVPSSLAIIGAGAIGVEFAQLYARFGTRVTLLEASPRILSNEDEAAAAALVPVLEGEGIELHAGVTIRRASHDPQGWRLEIEDGDAVRADELLVAAGRTPSLEGHDLAAAGVALDDEGKPVLGETLRTTSPDIWAAGDATGELLFTHVGAYEAGLVVDDILGRPRARDYRVVPRVTFCDPEVASVGLTEAQARVAGYDVRTSVVPIAENERATIDGTRYGVVKLVADAADGELLGGHIVADGAGAMIHEVVAMMAAHVAAPTMGDAIHAYPTLSESLKTAAARLK